jgi:hypothetical protein
MPTSKIRGSIHPLPHTPSCRNAQLVKHRDNFTFIIIIIIIRSLSRYSDGLRAGRPGFDSRQCKIFLFSTASRLALRLTQPPIRWVPGALSPGVKRKGPEADHSPQSSAEVKKGGAIHPLLHTPSWCSVKLSPSLSLTNIDKVSGNTVLKMISISSKLRQEDEIGETCSMHGEDSNAYTMLIGDDGRNIRRDRTWHLYNN